MGKDRNFDLLYCSCGRFGYKWVPTNLIKMPRIDLKSDHTLLQHSVLTKHTPTQTNHTVHITGNFSDCATFAAKSFPFLRMRISFSVKGYSLLKYFEWNHTCLFPLWKTFFWWLLWLAFPSCQSKSQWWKEQMIDNNIYLCQISFHYKLGLS